MFRVINLNVNGLRASIAKGLMPWLARQKADVVCLQEIRLGRDGAPPALQSSSWHSHLFPAEKPGYSGTAILSRQEPQAVRRGFGVKEFDDEGRCLELDFGALSVVSLYAPSGSSGDHRQASKDRFLVDFEKHCRKLLASGKPTLICGDINIAHTRKDLRNWRSNQKNSGFLEHERQWMDRWLQDRPRRGGKSGKAPRQWRDVFRQLNDKEDQYTWWSNRGQAWQNNVGWRIDYQIATDDIASAACREKIYKTKRFSDHSPLIIDYDIKAPAPKRQSRPSPKGRGSRLAGGKG